MCVFRFQTVVKKSCMYGRSRSGNRIVAMWPLTHPVRSVLLWLAVICAGLSFETASAISPTYTYEPSVDKRSDVCRYMQDVFNRDFTHLWDADPLMPKDDQHYSAASRYAFPTLPGVDHEDRATFVMRYSKVPTSSEFEAVSWQEGRAILGGEPGTQLALWLTTPRPVLIAYIDFDNDGKVDTVIKSGFTKDYNYRTFGKDGDGLSEEYLLVLRGQKMDVPRDLSLWTLQNDRLPPQRPIIVNSTYVRPFIYMGHTYVAQYDEDLGKTQAAGHKPPYQPKRETMSVVEYHFSGRSDATQRPQWDAVTICEFKMIQVPDVKEHR